MWLLLLAAYAQTWSETFEPMQPLAYGQVQVVAADSGASAAGASLCYWLQTRNPCLLTTQRSRTDRNLWSPGSITFVVRTLRHTSNAASVTVYNTQGELIDATVARMGQPVLLAKHMELLRGQLAASQDNARRLSGSGNADPAREAEASALLKDAGDAAESLDYESANRLLRRLSAEFGDTRASRAARRLEESLAVIGLEVNEWEVESWIQGEMPQDELIVVVFWELWCPHCKREVPKLEARSEAWAAQGIGLVGFTKLTRSVDEEQVRTYLNEQGIGFPIAKETGSLSELLKVRGIPAAAVVREGEVIWRGHPAKLTEDVVQSWL